MRQESCGLVQGELASNKSFVTPILIRNPKNHYTRKRCHSQAHDHLCSRQPSTGMREKHQPVEIEIVIEYYYFRIKFQQRSFSNHHPFSAGEMPVRFTLRAFLMREITSSAR
jgi:hypothetical protein